VSAYRGFLSHLLNNSKINYEFIVKNKKSFEIKQGKNKLLSKIIRNKIFDWLGMIQIIKCTNNDNDDIYMSFNRFVNSNKPYIIYLENPTALYHYSLNRNKTVLGRHIIDKCLKEPNLKAIICMSKACYNSFDYVCANGKKYNFIKEVIYPYIPSNELVSTEKIIERCNRGNMHFIFIAQGIRFVSKGALEIIEVCKILRKNNINNFNMTMVTSINEVEEKVLGKIRSLENINLIDYKLDYQKMKELYANSTAMIHPTSDDSYGLVVLEAMKAGLPIISTKLYAIPEMVTDGLNGFLTDPKWWFFDQNNIPNPKVWNHRGKTIHSQTIDKNLVKFIYGKIMFLMDNKELLTKMSLNSFKKANSYPFDEESITNRWNSLLDSIYS
jgi:glycosyltransferase involved in cell wall biosynthesis